MKKFYFLVPIIVLSCSNPDSCPELVFDPANKVTFNDNNPYTGRCSTYENDKIRSIQQYINGVDYGNWVFYFPNGNIETKGRFNKKGKRVKTWKYFYEDGTIKQVSKYDNEGRRHKVWKKYNEKGDLVEEINYSD